AQPQRFTFTVIFIYTFYLTFSSFFYKQTCIDKNNKLKAAICYFLGDSTKFTHTYDGRTKPVPRKGHPESYEPADNKCLLRASDGKKKISTVVSTKEVIKFQMAYSNLLRAHMDGLKKKDKKSKSKKTKATQ
uniref:Signal recognition particle 14 kDa protein n=1 Tax=Oncorhynchus tshawytscha TaxID=74940 RepID=A0AAZ3SD21_ONCTS